MFDGCRRLAFFEGDPPKVRRILIVVVLVQLGSNDSLFWKHVQAISVIVNWVTKVGGRGRQVSGLDTFRLSKPGKPATASSMEKAGTPFQKLTKIELVSLSCNPPPFLQLERVHV